MLFLQYIPLKYYALPQPVTNNMSNIVLFHNDIMSVIVFILAFIFSMLVYTVTSFSHDYNPRAFGYASRVKHSKVLEGLWVIIPSLIIVAILLPSLSVLYDADEPFGGAPQINVHINGNQWYWNYQYRGGFEHQSKDFLFLYRMLGGSEVWSPAQIYFMLENFFPDTIEGRLDIGRLRSVQTLKSFGKHTFDWCFTRLLDPFILNKINFDSRLLADTDKNAPNSIRLLDTDNPLIIPSFTSIRCLVTSNDVIHSWSVAPFGVKMDAIPGRLNQFFLNVNAIGVFYGQCSELCGVYHSFMPIHVIVVNPISFHTKEIYLLCLQHHKNWIITNKIISSSGHINPPNWSVTYDLTYGNSFHLKAASIKADAGAMAELDRLTKAYRALPQTEGSSCLACDQKAAQGLEGALIKAKTEQVHDESLPKPLPGLFGAASKDVSKLQDVRVGVTDANSKVCPV